MATLILARPLAAVTTVGEAGLVSGAKFAAADIDHELHSEQAVAQARAENTSVVNAIESAETRGVKASAATIRVADQAMHEIAHDNSLDHNAIGIMGTDDKGTVIVARESDDPGRDFSKTPYFQASIKVGMTAPLAEYFGQIQTFRNLAIAFSVIAIAIALIVFLIFVRGITRPIRQAAAYAQIVSSGDLTQTLEIDRGDELGQLASALKQMVGRLTNIVGGVFDGASNVTSGSQALSATAQELSDG